MYLRPHVDTLYEQIRNRAIIQYVSPYSSVSMVTMAESFNTTVPNLEKEIAKLITDGQIQARIDSHNKILYSRTTDQRSLTYQRAMELGENFAADTENIIRRVNLLRSEFSVRPPKMSGSSHISVGGASSKDR
eukprot:TRINITY_DN2912_c0_g1_i1.p2 TRINITY_DN2912_c0_g1~~TRINITY_DN2912_c0_g1_i1.p2  ORF type:complete len:133 (-),score=29.53 TRINITY_DN2912_c0_g1_i1:86-484(-)